MANTRHVKPRVIVVDTGPESRLSASGDSGHKTRHTDSNDYDVQRNKTASPNQKHTPPCVVCETRPRYSKQGKTYPTCGLTCAQKLRSGDGPRGMCWFCGVRSQHSMGSKQYRTCSTECNAKLEDGNASARMCDYCHKQPKFHDGKNIYPQCSTQCRDLSRRDMAHRKSAKLSRPSAPFKTNSACLLCWSVAMIPGSDLCKNCKAVTTAQSTGRLLEAPRGHATFDNVADQFKKAWDNGTQCPDVLEIYKILEPTEATANFMFYRDTINATGRLNELRRWHGTTRQCDRFDPGHLDLCSSKSQPCQMCLTIRNSFDSEVFTSGIYTSSTSSQSSVHTGTSGGRKIALLVDIVVGNVIERTPDENPHRGGSDYDAVELVEYNSNGRFEYDEFVVYNKNAVRPLYIVVYS